MSATGRWGSTPPPWLSCLGLPGPDACCGCLSVNPRAVPVPTTSTPLLPVPTRELDVAPHTPAAPSALWKLVWRSSPLMSARTNFGYPYETESGVGIDPRVPIRRAQGLVACSGLVFPHGIPLLPVRSVSQIHVAHLPPSHPQKLNHQTTNILKLEQQLAESMQVADRAERQAQSPQPNPYPHPHTPCSSS